MKEIQLTQGKVAIVDDEDFEYLNQWKWCAFNNWNKWYAQKAVYVDGKEIHITMHRMVLGDIPSGYCTDHINGDGLDNRRSNLRVCTHTQNQWNTPKQRNNTSGYKGVHWHKNEKRWHTNIRYKGKKYFIGAFDNKESAALAYNEAAIKYHGEFAYLNNLNSVVQKIKGEKR